MGRESKFIPEQRRDAVLQLLEGRPMVELVRDLQVSSTAIYRWKDQFLEGGLASLQGNGPSQRERNMEAEMRRMREIVGELALANYAMKRGRTPWTESWDRGWDGVRCSDPTLVRVCLQAAFDLRNRPWSRLLEDPCLVDHCPDSLP